MAGWFRLGTVLVLGACLTGCSIDHGGRLIVAIDPELRGCFEQGPGAASARIVIIQDVVNMLHGTGFGLFTGGTAGWSFTGRIDSRDPISGSSSATLSVTTVAGVTPIDARRTFRVTARHTAGGLSVDWAADAAGVRGSAELFRCP